MDNIRISEAYRVSCLDIQLQVHVGFGLKRADITRRYPCVGFPQLIAIVLLLPSYEVHTRISYRML